MFKGREITSAFFQSCVEVIRLLVLLVYSPLFSFFCYYSIIQFFCWCVCSSFSFEEGMSVSHLEKWLSIYFPEKRKGNNLAFIINFFLEHTHRNISMSVSHSIDLHNITFTLYMHRSFFCSFVSVCGLSSIHFQLKFSWTQLIYQNYRTPTYARTYAFFIFWREITVSEIVPAWLLEKRGCVCVWLVLTESNWIKSNTF